MHGSTQLFDWADSASDELQTLRKTNAIVVCSRKCRDVRQTDSSIPPTCGGLELLKGSDGRSQTDTHTGEQQYYTYLWGAGTVNGSDGG